jgi:hypothetical protein
MLGRHSNLYRNSAMLIILLHLQLTARGCSPQGFDKPKEKRPSSPMDALSAVSAVINHNCAD